MSRDIDSDDREPSGSSSSPSRVPGGDSDAPDTASLTGASRHSAGGGASTQERDHDLARQIKRNDPFGPRHPNPYRVLLWRDRVVAVSPSEQATLRTLGTFRTVARNDLAQHRYAGDRARLDRDVRRLERRHWAETHTLPGRFGGRSSVVLTLTREGHAFARRYLARDQQQFQWGMVRPREQEHDTALYRMAAAESTRLAKSGVSIRRVILDAELKGQLAAARNRPTPARANPRRDAAHTRHEIANTGRADAAHSVSDSDTRDNTRNETATREGERSARAERTQVIAESLHLKVVDGVVQIPDIRLEVEHSDGTIARVDLELATEHYKPGQLAAKARAGFTIYAPAHQSGRLSAALHDRGIMANILSI